MRPLVFAVVALGLAGCAAGDANPTDGTGGAGASSGSGGAGNGSATGGSGGEVVCTEDTKCDNTCVDLNSDPYNCGGCGRTCVVSQAEPSCDAGVCVLGACEDGFADCDGDVNNGCEAEASCSSGAVCTATCSGSGAEVPGVLSCTNPCTPSCELTGEICDLADNDCDDVCDNGPIAGCRVGVHRASGANGHFYSQTEAEATSLGFNIESTNYFRLYANATGGLQPLFRCPKGGGQFFLTTATDCEIGAAPVATLGFISPTADNCNSAPLYRTQNTASGNHFYTTSAAERDNAVTNLGYVSQGIAGYIWTAP